MQDTTVLGIGRASGSGAIARRKFSGQAVYHGDQDELLARVLVTSWSLASGRTLRAGVKPASLSAAELIDFWADDFCEQHQIAPAAGAW